jgi:hypothetical protein
MKSGLWPLVLLWLAAHALVLALILGIKFVTAKMVILGMLLAAGVFVVWAQLRAAPRRLLGHAS